MSITTQVRPRPILKWAGGKTSVLPALIAASPRRFVRYFEPFLGGGALFFELVALGRITTAYLSDVNQALMDVYRAVKEDVCGLIGALRNHPYDREYYYRLRATSTDGMSLVERAARMIYLNKTCYNGLYRENSSGQFNVPFGRYKNPIICDEAALIAASNALQGVILACHSFEAIVDVARPGDFVYFDPPYVPTSATANFTSYYRAGFGPREQGLLRDVFEHLASRSVHVMLSNSDTREARRLYEDRGWNIQRVLAPRSINCNGDRRGRVPELIVTNYPIELAFRPRFFEKRARYGSRDHRERPSNSRSRRTRSA